MFENKSNRHTVLILSLFDGIILRVGLGNEGAESTNTLLLGGEVGRGRSVVRRRHLCLVLHNVSFVGVLGGDGHLRLHPGHHWILDPLQWRADSRGILAMSFIAHVADL